MTRDIYHVSIYKPDLFLNWLAGKNLDDVIGAPLSPCFCPLANYLKDVLNTKALSVTHHYFYVGRRQHPLPLWAYEFIKEIDTIPRKGITVKDALNVLFNLYRPSEVPF